MVFRKYKDGAYIIMKSTSNYDKLGCSFYNTKYRQVQALIIKRNKIGIKKTTTNDIGHVINILNRKMNIIHIGC